MEINKVESEMEEGLLLNDLIQIIDHGRQNIAVTVNAEICMMHWHIGSG